MHGSSESKSTCSSWDDGVGFVEGKKKLLLLGFMSYFCRRKKKKFSWLAK